MEQANPNTVVLLKKSDIAKGFLNEQVQVLVNWEINKTFLEQQTSIITKVHNDAEFKKNREELVKTTAEIEKINKTVKAIRYLISAYEREEL